MHTLRHTGRPAARHTLKLGNTWYYNRRVPKVLQEHYGAFVRIALTADPDEARMLAETLSERLDQIWAGKPLSDGYDIRQILDSCRPKPHTISSWAREYVELRDIEETPTRVAVEALIALVGDRDVRDLHRSDARALVNSLSSKGNATRTVRRRVDAISAVLNYAFAELEVEKRNPFRRVFIPQEGRDAKRRATFTLGELYILYRRAFASENRLHLLAPLLGETGCRMAEIVGLRVQDVDLKRQSLAVVGHSARRLKTSHSERIVPLVGRGLEAARILFEEATEESLFPRYQKHGITQATHASNALNKWIKMQFQGKTAHGLRHTFRDRLRAVECPMEMIDHLGGWKTINSVGASYGSGYDLEHKRKWVKTIELGRG